MKKGRVFVDTNLLVYAFDPSDEKKRRLSVERIRGVGSRMVISTQVLQEFFSVVTKKIGLPRAEARELLLDLCENEVVPSTPDLVKDAVDLAIVTGYSIWDALVIQAAIASRCELLLSEDLNHGQTVKGVRLENPFLTD